MVLKNVESEWYTKLEGGNHAPATDTHHGYHNCSDPGYFTYDGHPPPGGCGLDDWAAISPFCAGDTQSPIDIPPPALLCGDRKYALPPFPAAAGGVGTGYRAANCTVLSHGRGGLRCDRAGDEAVASSLPQFVGMQGATGGPTAYSLERITWHYTTGPGHLHVHDGGAVGGSEHTLGGLHYPLEMQLVHVNKDRYQGVDDALASGNTDALLIVAVLFRLDTDRGGTTPSASAREFSKLVAAVATLPAASPVLLDPAKLLPTDRAFAAYRGSLTRPSCNPAVTWLVMTTPATVGNASLAQLQSTLQAVERQSTLQAGDAGPGAASSTVFTSVHGNSRPVQPTNGRTVFHSAEGVRACSTQNLGARANHSAAAHAHTVPAAAVAHTNNNNNASNNAGGEEGHHADSPPVLFGLSLDGHGVTFHFVINEVLMCFFFGVAAQELTESMLPGGILYPPKLRAINPIITTWGGIFGPIAVYVQCSKLAATARAPLLDLWPTSNQPRCLCSVRRPTTTR